MNLEEFIAEGGRNAWIYEPGLEYYVRKSMYFPGLIELANVVGRGMVRGAYWRFLKKYEDAVPFIAEQVGNDDLAALYRRRRWLEKDIGGTPQFMSPLGVRLYAETRYFKMLWPVEEAI